MVQGTLLSQLLSVYKLVGLFDCWPMMSSRQLRSGSKSDKNVGGHKAESGKPASRAKSPSEPEKGAQKVGRVCTISEKWLVNVNAVCVSEGFVHGFRLSWRDCACACRTMYIVLSNSELYTNEL